MTGCQTCDCEEVEQPPKDKTCEQVVCDLTCKYRYQRDENGCEICACNQCPLGLCRMFCAYGFRRNEDGCEICECDWRPVAEKILCDEVGFPLKTVLEDDFIVLIANAMCRYICLQ